MPQITTSGALADKEVLKEFNQYGNYADLVRTGTRFWEVSGVRASWGLFSGLDLETESMEAVIAGGIALATPDGGETGEPAGNGAHYILHEKNEQTWLDWSPVIMLNEEAKLPGQVQ